MNEKTNYGKIIAITLSVITAAAAVAFVVYRLVRNLITFCAVYDEPEEVEDAPLFDELDEEITDETADAPATGEEATDEEA